MISNGRKTPNRVSDAAALMAYLNYAHYKIMNKARIDEQSIIMREYENRDLTQLGYK
jgi:hypothetical protein